LLLLPLPVEESGAAAILELLADEVDGVAAVLGLLVDEVGMASAWLAFLRLTSTWRSLNSLERTRNVGLV